jgi:hypothetical protein
LKWVDEDEQNGAVDDLPNVGGGMGGMGEDGGFNGIGMAGRIL